MTTLNLRPLDGDYCRYLGPKLQASDIADLTLHHQCPDEALFSALSIPGQAYCVRDGDTPIGAGGWTEEGAVWTLWTDLTISQSAALLRCCVPWARIMAIRAERPLHNVFLASNSITASWLEATRCVNILYNRPLTWHGREYIPFFLKSLEELPYV